MSAPKVDVLAVMDAQIAARDAMNNALGGKSCVTHELRQARAAVAELIEAARFFEDESRRKYGDNTTGGARLRVALARIGGAA